MKTIMNTKTREIRRVTDNNAKMLVPLPDHEIDGLGHWFYVSKSIWKKQVRDKLPDKPAEE